MSNAIGYISPNLGGFVVRARYYLRSEPGNESFDTDAKSLDLSMSYAHGPWRTGISYARDTRPGGLLPNEFADKWQTGLRYDAGWVAPYVLIGRDTYANTPTSRHHVNYWLLGVKFSHNAHTVVLNVMDRAV